MKKIDKIISAFSFLTVSLIITNVWIFLYLNILKYLNTLFPPQAPIGFIRSDAAPEPFEIPLYLGLSFVFVIVLWLANSYIIPLFQRKINLKLPKIIYASVIFLAFFSLLFLFLKNIDSYPMARDIYPYTTSETPMTYQLFLFIYLTIMALILFETAVLEKMIQKKRRVFIFFMVLIIFLIAVVTFEPRFPMVGHDNSFFFGPIWEIAHGKTIYTDAPALYGFTSTLLFTALYKIGVLNIWYLPALVWLLYIAEYFLVFYLIHKISKSLLLALISLFSLITVNYFSIFLLPATIPQTGPLRWLPMVVAIYLIYRFKRLDSKYILFTFPLLVFWFLDSGIFLAMSYFFSLFILFVNKRINLKRVLIYFFAFVLISIGFFILINVVQLIFGYKFINIFMLFKKMREYALAGFGMLQMPNNSYFWLVILIYFASLIYLARKQLNNANYQLLLFAANIMLFSGIYFVGRSHPHNLFHIGTFVILNLFILLSLLYPQIKNKLGKFIFYFALFTITVVFPAYERQEILTKTIKEKISRFRQGNIFIPESENLLKIKYKNDVAMINREIPDKKITVFSDDDTYLLYLTDKQNLLNYNPEIINIAKDDFQYSLKEAVLKCPKKIVGDCRLFDKCADSELFSLSYIFIQPQFLDHLETSCKNHYEPVECTNHLCIGEAK